MIDSVKDILNVILAKDLAGSPVEASIVESILKNGFQSLEISEIEIFDNFILPFIKEIQCACNNCWADVYNQSIEDAHKFMTTGLCSRCNNFIKTSDDANEIRDLFEPL